MVKTCKNRTFKHNLNANNPRQNDRNQDHARRRTKTKNKHGSQTRCDSNKIRTKQLKDQSNQETKT